MLAGLTLPYSSFTVQPGIGWTAQHIELATALVVTWEEYARAKQETEIDWESAGSALARRITIVVLAAALCESAVNLYLSLKLEAAEFEKIERQRPFDKWTAAIQALAPGYTLAETESSDLRFLFGCRDSVMHPKPKMTDARGVRHEGTAEVWEKIDEAAIARIWNLPLRLLRNLESFEPFPAAFIHSSLSPYLTDYRLRKGLEEQKGSQDRPET